MTIVIKDVTYDTMKEACERLGISRPSMLRYLKDEIFTPPKTHSQGLGKVVRYFDNEWYHVNTARLQDARDASAARTASSQQARRNDHR